MIADKITYIGVRDTVTDLFEGQYKIPDGITYNSYLINDKKIAVLDTVDVKFTDEWKKKLDAALVGRTPDYLVVHHMEPDHSANILNFTEWYPSATVVSSAKAFAMMKLYFGTDFAERRIVVADSDELSLGERTLKFIAAPMVHWPEVMMSYELRGGLLFSADGFGRFGSDDDADPWDDEARRYYIGIVGKYGAMVKNVLKKAAALDIKAIYPLHGPIIKTDIARRIALYEKWASYTSECDGITVAYTSVYGNTKRVAEALCEKLSSFGATVALHDLARCDIHEAVADSFRYSKLVLATTTYNADIFPYMKEFINHLTERGFSSRMVAFIENGSWAPIAKKVMTDALSSCKNLTYAENSVKILGAPNSETEMQLEALVKELIG